jgi:polar amino acid transport system substrate-binding protein
MKARRLAICIIIVSLLCAGALIAKEYKAAVKELPTTDTYKSRLTAIVEASGNTVAIQVVPPARADFLIENKQVDFQLPFAALPDLKKFKDLNVDYSSAVLYKIAFVMFTNKSKAIDMESLKKGNPNNYKIEIDPSRAFEYEFTGIPSSNFEASFKKLDAGQIDGLILSQTTGDNLLKKLALKTVKRQLWAEYDMVFTIAKGAKNGEVDKMLLDGVNKLKAAKKFDEIVGPLAKTAKWDNWQP